MTFFKSAITIFISLTIFVYSHAVIATVNCEQVTSLIKRSLMPDAVYIMDKYEEHNIPLLCSFHVAWALKTDPDAARPYIDSIKNILDKREPFYYQALYLKLLLLEDLSDEEIRRTLKELSNAKPKLAKQISSGRLESFQQKYQKLLIEPFKTKISVDNPWLENAPEIKPAEQILALVNEINRRNAAKISKANSEAIINLFNQLRKTDVKIDDKHDFFLKHQDYLRYFRFMEQARTLGVMLFSERLASAKQAYAIITKHHEDDDDAAKNLVEELQSKPEIELEKALSELFNQVTRQDSPLLPYQLNLSEVMPSWGLNPLELSEITKELKVNDAGFLKVLNLYTNCRSEQTSYCLELVKLKPSSQTTRLDEKGIKPFKKRAKYVLKKNAEKIAAQIEAIINNNNKKKIYTIKTANKEVQRIFQEKSAILKYLAKDKEKHLKSKIDSLGKIEHELYVVHKKDWSKIFKLSESIEITYKFDELSNRFSCKRDQEEIKKAIRTIQQNRQAAIEICDQTLQIVTCPDAQIRLKLIETVLKKIITDGIIKLNMASYDEFNKLINQIVNDLTRLLSRCKAVSPLKNWVLEAKVFFENLRKQGPDNLAAIKDMLKDPQNIRALIKSDFNLNPPAKTVSVSDTQPQSITYNRDAGDATKEVVIPPYCSTVSEKSGFWSWKKSAFKYMLVYNQNIQKVYHQLFFGRNSKTKNMDYPYFVAGMNVWRGKKGKKSYEAGGSPSYYLAIAVEVLRNNIENANAIDAASHFKSFYEAVKRNTPVSMWKLDGTQKFSELSRAHFIQSFFIGIWYLERQDYQNSRKVIQHAYLKYKYTAAMNLFAKNLMESISELERLDDIY